MRDPKRIYAFCNKLAEHWSKVPDWRFGQLLSNVLGQEMKGKDLFFPEEDEMMGYFDHFFEAWDTKTIGGKIVNNHVDIKQNELKNEK